MTVYYDASIPHVNPGSGVWCPCLSGHAGSALPLIVYSHYMLNPFGGSTALCDSVHNGECVTLVKEDVNCPRCLPLMDSPIAIASDTALAAQQMASEREWRQSDPASASFWDTLRRMG